MSSHHPADRELLQGSIARNRSNMIDRDGDDARYDVRSAEKASSVSNKSQSLQELMRSQQAAMDVAEDRHNKEYIPLLNKAIEAIGGDPTGHHPSGGSGSTPRTSRPTSRGTSPRSSYQCSPSNLKDMLASQGSTGESVHSTKTPAATPPTLVGVATTASTTATAPLSPSRPSVQKGGLSPRGSSTTKSSGEPNLREMLRDASNNNHQPTSPPVPPPRSPRPSPGRPSSPPGAVVQHARSPRSTSPNFRGGVIRTGSGGAGSDRESLRDMLKDHHPLATTPTTTSTSTTTASHHQSPQQHVPQQQRQPQTVVGSSSKTAAAVHDDLDSTIPYLDRTQNPTN